MTKASHSKAPTHGTPARIASRQVSIADNTLDDNALMQRTAKGDRAAGQALIRRHLPYVQRVLAQKLRDAAEIDEAAQDVFLSLWRTAHKWRPNEARLTTWLYRVASNKAIDILRRRRPHVDIDEAHMVAADDKGAEQILVEQDQARLMARALDTLTDAQRQAIELVYFQSMPQADAALQLGVSLKALESTLRPRPRDFTQQTHKTPPAPRLTQRLKEMDMNRQAFERLIAAYGSKRENWPSQHRAAMAEYCANTHDSQSALADETMLDALLDTYAPPPASNLLAAFDAGLDAHLAKTRKKPIWRAMPTASAALALAACFVLGVVATPELINIYLGDNLNLLDMDPAGLLIATAEFEIIN